MADHLAVEDDEVDKLDKVEMHEQETTDGSEEEYEMQSPVSIEGEGDYHSEASSLDSMDQEEPPMEEEHDFTGHVFYGPKSDNPSVLTLHGQRTFERYASKPRFMSPSITFAIPEESYLMAEGEEVQGDVFEVMFHDEAPGMSTSIDYDEDGNMRVTIQEIEDGLEAKNLKLHRGDMILAVNDQVIKSDMEKDKVFEIIRDSPSPKTMLLFRKPAPRHVPNALMNLAKKAESQSIFSGIKSSFTKMETAIKRNSLNVSVFDAQCSSCSVYPIRGSPWICKDCLKTVLCTSCYERGDHGMEKSPSMKLLNDALIREHIKKRCKKFTNKFLEMLLRDICKGRTDKFQYMGYWLADIVGGAPPSKITVRGLEIPRLSSEQRMHFVQEFMPLASNRTDLEVNIEWFAEENTSENGEATEKLRLWISDKKKRTKSPFE